MGSEAGDIMHRNAEGVHWNGRMEEGVYAKVCRGGETNTK